MVSLKRQAENPITSHLHAKRQRITKNKATAATPQDHSQDEDESTGEYHIDFQCISYNDDKLAASFAERLTAMNTHADQRKTWAEDFEAEVTASKTSLILKIEGAKTELEEKRESFKSSMLPVLSAALQDFHLESTPTPAIQLPLQIEIAHTTKIVTKASHLLKSCQTIIACYEELVEAGPVPSSTAKLRETVAKDRRALEIAFTGARKIVASHVQSQIPSGRGEYQEKPQIDEEEENFGQKILKKSRIAQDRGSKRGIVLGDVCHDLGKVVDKMQQIVGL